MYTIWPHIYIVLTLYAKRFDGQSFMNYYQRVALSLEEFDITFAYQKYYLLYLKYLHDHEDHVN